MSTRHQYTTLLVRKTLHRSFKAAVKSRNKKIVEVVAELLKGYIAKETQESGMLHAPVQDKGAEAA